MTLYLIIAVVLFVLELLYFRVAERGKIIDKPNERSSHSHPTDKGWGDNIHYWSSIIFMPEWSCLSIFVDRYGTLRDRELH